MYARGFASTVCSTGIDSPNDRTRLHHPFALRRSEASGQFRLVSLERGL